MDTKLQGKVALVTGAAQGIGQGIAVALAEEGCRIVVADLHEEACKETLRLVAEAGSEAVAVACNVAVAADVSGLFVKTIEHFGGIDVVVNNAGIFPFMPIEQMTEEQWDKVLDINLKGTFLVAQKAAGFLPAGGRIVNVSSIASVIGFAAMTHYCASKSGVNGLTRALALELAPKQIAVNAVAPGATATPGASVAQTDEVLQQTIQQIPLARQGTPQDIANAVVFLASEQSSYITGQVMVVDGGWTLR